MQSEREIWHTYEGNRLTDTEADRYGSVNDALKAADFFEPVSLNNFTSEIPWRKYEYLKSFAVGSRTVRYTITGGHRNLDFAWRVPTSYDEASLLSANIKVRDKINADIPRYHSNAMKRVFVHSFGSVTNCKSAILRKAYQFLTGDASASRNATESELDERVGEMLSLQDPDLVTDLRINNAGQPERYDVFLEECQKYIVEKVETAVDDRRHDTVSGDGDVVVHLAAALSVRDLHSQVQKRCPDAPIPSVQWLRLQFWPKRVNVKTSSSITEGLKSSTWYSPVS